MNIKTKIAAALTLAVLVVPGISMAQTQSVASIQAEIQSLTIQLQALESQAAANLPTSPVCPVSGCSELTPITTSSLSVLAPKLTVTKNTALGSQVVVPGATNIEIGSYAFTASSTEAVNVNTVDIQVTPAATTTIFQNLKLMINGTQFGATQAVATANGTYAFAGPSFNVPAGQTVNVNVSADVLSSGTSNTYVLATAEVGYKAIGATSNIALTSTSIVDGQRIIFSTPPAFVVVADTSENPLAGEIVQNSTGNTLAVFRFAAYANKENIVVSQVNVVAAVASTQTAKPAFSNLTLWSGSTELGTAQAPVADAAGTGYIYAFSALSNPLAITPSSTVVVTLKGDAGSYNNGSLTDGSTFTFEIATTTDADNNTPALAVVARGMTSNEPAKVALTHAIGNPQEVVRTMLAVAGIPVTGMPPASFQPLGTIIFAANTAGDAVLNDLKLTFNSAATSSFLHTVVLRDQNGNDVVAGDNLAKSSISSQSILWTFTTSTKPLDITAGSSYTLTVWGNLADIPAIPGIAQSLTAEISIGGNFGYLDGTGGSPILLHLLPSQVPVTVIDLTSAPGGQAMSNSVNSPAQTAIVDQSLQSLLGQIGSLLKSL